jgi:hypothetical protein
MPVTYKVDKQFNKLPKEGSEMSLNKLADLNFQNNDIPQAP